MIPLALLAVTLLVTGAGSAYWGLHTLEPDYCYVGLALVTFSFLPGFIALALFLIEVL